VSPASDRWQFLIIGMSSLRISWCLFLFLSKSCPISLPALHTDSLSRPGEMRKRNQGWVKAMVMHIPNIPVALNLPLVCKFTLLIGRAVSQVAGCDKTSTPLFFLYFCAIFPSKTIRRVTAKGTHLGTSGDQPGDIRLDIHLHNRLARPTTLRQYQCRLPYHLNAYTLYWSAHNPPNHFATFQTCRWPSTQTTLFVPLFSLGQYRPVPLLSGSLPPFLHDIMPRMGHTPLSFHSLSGAIQLANPYIWGTLLTEPLSHGALLWQAS
jgi:hypothetical protein